ncbi:MAG: aldolase/citrate lyase family protein [Chloroflexi bacterium]|nr:aldolase/citrate lyase family protein [Chloroflexota bacterium]MCY4247416.1 aldolase/citrate lyase family protein [Chloroflexota bacterium]
MRKNRVREIWAAGRPALNGWLHIPSAWSAEVMANQDWDSLVIDMQHGMMGMETAIIMLQAISTTDTAPLARVNWNTPGDIMRLLDAGAYGIICPMIETRQQCEAFVGACRFPPLGYRSLGPTRARVYAGADYAEHANDTVLTFAMIETQLGFDNRDEIMAVAGLDAVFVGIGDLRLSMTGQAGFDRDTVVDAALDDILASARQHSLKAGIFCANTDHAIEMIGRGYDFITVMTETAILSSAAGQIISTVRAG